MVRTVTVRMLLERRQDFLTRHQDGWPAVLFGQMLVGFSWSRSSLKLQISWRWMIWMLLKDGGRFFWNSFSEIFK